MADDANITNSPRDASSTVEAPTQSFEQFFTFDGGNIEISVLVQGEVIQCKVCSHSMVLASPVWKKFIFPPWKIDTWSQVKTIDFSDDDASALLILLRLAHHQSNLVPTKLSLETLYQVAIQTEKYDCFNLIHLFFDKWRSTVRDEASKDESGEWLYICWAFGREDDFQEVAVRMTKSLKVAGGACLTSTGSALTEPLPDKIIENIMRIRADTVENILQIVYDEVEKYENLDKVDTILCKSGRMSCDAMVYGSLLIGLQQKYLWPEVKASELALSINEIAGMIRELKIHIHPQTGGKSGPTHFNCSTFRGCPALEKVLKDMPSPVLECHTIHMRNRLALTIPVGDPLMESTLCARCSEDHPVMVACAVNEKKRSAPTD